MMKYYIFRNTTIEPFFNPDFTKYSGYDDISIIDLSADIYVWFYILPFLPDTKLLVNQVDSYYNNLKLVYDQIPTQKLFCIFTLNDMHPTQIQTGDFTISKAITEFNRNIIQFGEQNKNVKIIDFSTFIYYYSIEQLIDWKFYFISKMQLNPKLSSKFKYWFESQMNSILMKRKKCLVLDLDNTLWGGVLGEDGINGIKIGGDYPGNAFLEFQKSILELTKSGIILTVCSKNNETDVIDVWQHNPYLLIKKENISAYKINWNNKAENIKLLSEELNIGLDSMVFIDDSPSERELVKKFLPMVETPDFPLQPYNLKKFINEITENFFQIYKVTEEDKTKTEQYKSNTERTNFQQGFTDFTEYLASLEICILMQKADTFTIPRIAQMTQKTNQFNLTTHRYTEGDIASFADNGDAVYSISVKDKFGDNGITGLIIIRLNEENQTADIDSLLLSCRILGKGIEEAFIFFVLNQLKQEGYKKIYASYLPTSKNEQVKSFYDTIGFTIISEDNPSLGVKNYSLDLRLSEFKIKHYYKIETQQNERKN